jgi:hypothetical protein
MTTGVFVEFIEDWTQFFQPCNWYTFRPLMIEIEHDAIMGGVEATCVLLGVGFRIRWNYAETEESRRVAKMMADLENVIAEKGAGHDAPPTP